MVLRALRIAELVLSSHGTSLYGSYVESGIEVWLSNTGRQVGHQMGRGPAFAVLDCPFLLYLHPSDGFYAYVWYLMTVRKPS